MAVRWVGEGRLAGNVAFLRGTDRVGLTLPFVQGLRRKPLEVSRLEQGRLCHFHQHNEVSVYVGLLQ